MEFIVVRKYLYEFRVGTMIEILGFSITNHDLSAVLSSGKVHATRPAVWKSIRDGTGRTRSEVLAFSQYLAGNTGYATQRTFLHTYTSFAGRESDPGHKERFTTGWSRQTGPSF
jgi:hypothetical protein